MKTRAKISVIGVAIVSWLAILASWVLLDSFNLSLVCSAVLFFVSIAYAWRMDAKANPKKMDPLRCQSCGYDRSGLPPPRRVRNATPRRWPDESEWVYPSPTWKTSQIDQRPPRPCPALRGAL